MKTTINLSDELISKAMKETGIKEKTTLIHMGLELILKNKAQERLANSFGTYKNLKKVQRDRPKNSK